VPDPTIASEMRLAPVSPAGERAALAYLAGAPLVNVFVTYLLMYDLSPATRRKIWIASDASGVRGAVYFGRQLALACDPQALDAIAMEARRHRGERMIIGEREIVRAYWRLVRRWHQPPRLTRDRQFVMVLERDDLERAMAPLRERLPKVTVRHATFGDLPQVAENSASLIEQELAYDPRAAAADFSANIRHMIEHELWWVGESEGRLCFFCNIGPWCRQTAQLQGIWTPPEMRGAGLATAAFAAICDRLLEHSPTLSLYVNDFNRPAIALYERIGFRNVADFSTLLF
jgi:predicted GNAT family acetyltransferase